MVVNPALSKSTSGNLAFVKEVAKYFMDFLETDFHKRNIPKRSIKLRNRDNLLTGVNLSKYPTFLKEIYKLVANSFSGDGTKKLSRSVYRSNLPQNLLEVVKLQIGKIKATSLKDLTTAITNEIEKLAVLYSKEHDKAISTSHEYNYHKIKEIFVLPFISSIEKPIQSLDIGDEDELYLIEEELTEILSKLSEDRVSNIVNRLIAGDKIDVNKELTSSITLDDVKESIFKYFENLQVGDLFNEVNELRKNKEILDKQDFYLYFGDISYAKVKYPIFYLPLSIDQTGDSLTISFDQQLYVNKKALEYVVQEYNEAKRTKGTLSSTAERIIYLSNHLDNLPEELNKISTELSHFFQLDRSIDFSDSSTQLARSLMVRQSNAIYISLFDKSDESLVNDYEEIIQQLSSESGELAELFNTLINDFIHNNPISFNPEVEAEWDKLDAASKLVFESPIALNSEQQQILSAIRKDDCKYIIVEGPPGTGKSHTITAISFDTILRHKSVLILSDKKEALDVVENKITETMNKVRYGNNEFQNPILRLGKTGNTYSQILARSTLEKIKTNHRAVNKHLPDLELSLSKLQNALKEDISAEVVISNDIDFNLIQDYYDLEARFDKKGFPFDVDEVLYVDDAINAIIELRDFFRSLVNFENGYKFKNALNLSIEQTSSTKILREKFSDVVNLNTNLSQILANNALRIDPAKELGAFSESSLLIAKEFISKYERLRMPIIGYLFSGSKLDILVKEFRKAFPFVPKYSTHKQFIRLSLAVDFFEHINSLKAKEYYLYNCEGDYLARVAAYLTSVDSIRELAAEVTRLGDKIKDLEKLPNVLPITFAKLEINPTDPRTWINNGLVSMDDREFDAVIQFLLLRNNLEKSFGDIPLLNYTNKKREIEKLVTTKVTNLLDSRVIDFYTNNSNDAATLRDIIKSKRKFPKDQFAKLKEAFPCILSGIRDYAEFIPLEPSIFDLVIIDEASQVSIAQAFPALIRAKKVLILGDKKQFSNVKSAQARSETNTEYKNRIKSLFKREFPKEDSKLIKVDKFDIKTSILEFFESISNFQIQLLKHFRGYREIIGYSNKNFYADSLQVMKIRAKNINEVIKFTYVSCTEAALVQNTNRAEIAQIVEELAKIKNSTSRPSLGVITPHTNQQSLLMSEISRLPEKDFYFNELKLKIMTFDTCQGEERDVIFYSMVASEFSDKLWGVFIKDISIIDSEEDGKVKVQRLNVGFSRAKECVHFICSKPLDKYTGSIGEALRYFQYTLEESKKEKAVTEVDSKSKMEPEVLNWFYQTKFWKDNKHRIEFHPQFEIGKYLKQLDATYQHPNYKVDFLILYTDESNRTHKIIIEYDGFREHFKNASGVNAINYDKYLSEGDIYRQKVLESYGYKFLRINKFNAGKAPVETLDIRIGVLLSTIEPRSSILDNVQRTVKGLESGIKKECPKCKEVLNLDDFKDSSLQSGSGRFCRNCKGLRTKTTQSVQTPVESLRCPKCASLMVDRKGRYGGFYGCSKYPRCNGYRVKR